MDKNLQLLILCTKKNINILEKTLIYNYLINKETNISNFISFSLKHGVLPIVYYQIKTIPNIPDEISIQFKNAYLYISKKNILMSAELIKILKELKQYHINVLAFKGPTLAKIAYDDITKRQFSDLDILIKKQDFDKFSNLLIEKGYIPYYPIEQYKNSKKTLFKLNNDVPFYHKNKKLSIEIHWDFFKKLYIHTDKLEPWKNQQQISINNYTIDTLSNSTLLLYHSLHGSKHIWERFLWIVDIDRLIRNVEDINWDEILTKANRLGVKKMFLLGPALAKHYLNTPLPINIVKEIDKMQFNNIIKYIEQEFKSDKQTSEDSLVKLSKVLLLKDNIYYQFMTLFEFIFKPYINERRMIVLSDRWFWLYWIIRPFGMTYRFILNKLTIVFKS